MLGGDSRKDGAGFIKFSVIQREERPKNFYIEM